MFLNKTTKEVFTLQQLKKLHNASIPNLGPDNLFLLAHGYARIVVGNIPQPGPGQIAYDTGNYEIEGITATKVYALRDKNEDELRQDAISAISQLEQQVTPRRIREAVLTEEGKLWLDNIDSQIEELRNQLQEI